MTTKATTTKKKTATKKKKASSKVAKRSVALAKNYDNDLYNLDLNPFAAMDKKAQKAQQKLLEIQVRNQKIIAARKAALKKMTDQQLLDQAVNSPQEFCYVMEEYKSRFTLPVQIQLADRWYPVPIISLYARETFFGPTCDVQVQIKFYDVNWVRRLSVDLSDFTTREGILVQKTFQQVIESLGLKHSDANIIDDNKATVQDTLRFNKKPGQVLDATSSALMKSYSWFGPPILNVPYASAKHPRLVIVEPDLELETKDNYNYDDGEDEDLALPFVRTFSLDLKKYIFVDVRDLQDHKFQENVIHRLVLPNDLKDVVTSVFDAKDVFGDLFANRHGGMVIMANGGPGVGKTLSAEVFAEKSKRPLYVLEMGELGVNLQQVEEALNLIFTRAARWNTVLLFDEVDIFFAKRTEHDLERNAIVGVFLRLLDQYKGLLFLTTNRAEVIDPAFASRITLRLDYPALTSDIRSQIWHHMLEAAELTIDGDMSSIVRHTLNGRQIRNVVRLLKAVTSDKTISVATVENYIKYSPTTK